MVMRIKFFTQIGVKRGSHFAAETDLVKRRCTMGKWPIARTTASSREGGGHWSGWKGGGSERKPMEGFVGRLNGRKKPMQMPPGGQRARAISFFFFSFFFPLFSQPQLQCRRSCRRGRRWKISPPGARRRCSVYCARWVSDLIAATSSTVWRICCAFLAFHFPHLLRCKTTRRIGRRR